MKTAIKAIVLGLALSTSVSALASEAPVKVNIGSLGMPSGAQYRVISVTSVTDGLIINNVITNRGQCRASYGNPARAFQLKFGATQEFRYMTHNQMNGNSYPCNVVEIQVNTNKGNYTFTPTR